MLFQTQWNLDSSGFGSFAETDEHFTLAVTGAHITTANVSSFSNTKAMGLLSGVACLVAFACDVLLAPALMKAIGYRENEVAAD